MLLDYSDKDGMPSLQFALNFVIGFQVLLTSCKVMAPFTPFFTEVLYQNMRKVCTESEESIHYCSFPQEEGEVLLIYTVAMQILSNRLIFGAGLWSFSL